jgi:small subunit ribosomal protein S19
MPKEILYRGKHLEDLKKLDIREFAKDLTSRKRRSVLRQYNEIQKFLNDCIKKQGAGKHIKTHRRDMIILPHMVGLKIEIHNGKDFVPVEIKTEMIGHLLGEFAFTRKRVEHSAPGIGATRSSSALSVK